MAQNDIVSSVKSDHNAIKELLQKAMNEEHSFEESLSLYKDLSVLITAHIKAEEAVLYVKLAQHNEHKKYAYQGFEDHGLVELLIEEMKSERNLDRWRAKFETLCKLIDRHIDEEESEYFPRVKSTYSDTQLVEMGTEYKEVFESFLRSQSSFASEMKDMTTH